MVPPTTTLMYRNVPRKFNDGDLLWEISVAAGPGLVNFQLLPWEGSVRNMGYAFVNFVDNNAADRVREAMHGKRWSTPGVTKSIKIVTANVQGLIPNIALACQAFNEGCGTPVRPLVFLQGRVVDFAEAVRLLSLCGTSAAGGAMGASGPEPPRLGRPAPLMHRPRPAPTPARRLDLERLTLPPQERSDADARPRHTTSAGAAAPEGGVPGALGHAPGGALLQGMGLPPHYAGGAEPVASIVCQPATAGLLRTAIAPPTPLCIFGGEEGHGPTGVEASHGRCGAMPGKARMVFLGEEHRRAWNGVQAQVNELLRRMARGRQVS